MGCRIGTKCHLSSETVNEENKSVEVVLSDETEIVRYSWEDGEYYLTLSHEESAVNLERAEILALFINHDTYDLPIGKFSNVRLEDKKLKATAFFDEDDTESMKIFNKLKKGFLQSFSVGVNIDTKILTKEENGIKYYKATRWSLNEASVVGIPAIPNAKVGLKNEVATDALLQAKTAKINTGVTMKFDRDNLDDTEASFNALVANRDTLTSRMESLKIDGETKTVALDALNAEMDKLKISMDGKVAGAEKAFADYKAEMQTRLAEAVSTGVTVEVAVDMVNADSKEDASKLALKANESDGGTNQTEKKEEDGEFAKRAENLGLYIGA